jgi:hypothetical protein
VRRNREKATSVGGLQPFENMLMAFMVRRVRS